MYYKFTPDENCGWSRDHRETVEKEIAELNKKLNDLLETKGYFTRADVYQILCPEENDFVGEDEIIAINIDN